MVDTFTAPILLDFDTTSSAEVLHAVSLLAAKTRLNLDGRIEQISIVRNGTLSGVVFYDGHGPTLYIKAIYAGYEGNSPTTLDQILRLFGVSERGCERIQKAAFCTGEIRYSIVLNAKYGVRDSWIGAVERLVTGNQRHIRWTWHREY